MLAGGGGEDTAALGDTGEQVPSPRTELQFHSKRSTDTLPQSRFTGRDPIHVYGEKNYRKDVTRSCSWWLNLVLQSGVMAK